MEIKAILTTASGSSETLEGYLSNPIIKRLMGLSGKGVKKFTLYTNDIDKVILEIECDYKQFLKINKNLSRFGFMLKTIMEKITKSSLICRRYNLSEEDVQKLLKLSKEQPDIEIIKKATADEMTSSGESFWTKFKKRFRKSEEKK